jgi:tryptophanyl-tRNA synthetase
MWRSVADLHAHMDADAAIAELRAQIGMALALGVDVTHQIPYVSTRDAELAKILCRTAPRSAAKPTGCGAISIWRIR